MAEVSVTHNPLTSRFMTTKGVKYNYFLPICLLLLKHGS